MAKQTEQQKRRRKLEKERADFNKWYLPEHPTCEVEWDVECSGFSQVVHEFLKFSGGGKRELGNVVASCNHCHERIHSNVAKAKELGWLRTIPPKSRGRVS